MKVKINNMKAIISLCGTIMLCSTIQAQQYKYTPRTASPVNNQKTYQFTPSNSQNNNTTPTTNNTPSNSNQNSALHQFAVSHQPTSRTISKSTIEAIRNTELGVRLQQQYGSSFTGVTKTMDFGSGNPSLTVQVVKNPSYKGEVSVDPSISDSSSSDQNDLACTTSQVSLNANSTSFMVADYDHVGAFIYPGAIFSADDFFGGNYNRDIDNYRTPIILSIDNPDMRNNSITVSKPNMQNVRNAVSQLFSSMPATNPVSEGTQYQVFSSNNSAEQTLKATGGGGGYGVTISGGVSNSQADSTLNLTIDARKTLFTINAIPPENGFFSNTSQTSPSNNLIMINQVEYGMRILANVQITFHSQNDALNFSAKYSKFGISANASLDDISQSHSATAEINYYQIGGPANGQSGSLAWTAGELQEQISQIFNSISYTTAMPIGYNVCDLALDEIGTKSETDQFPETLCVPDGTLQSAMVNVTTGNDDKDNNTYYYYTLYDGSNNEIASFSNTSQDSYFKELSNYTNQLTLEGSFKPTQFMNSGGGHLHVHIQPNGGLGHDTWVIQYLTLTLNFAGQSYPISWGTTPANGGTTDTNTSTPAATVSQNNPDYDFYFDNTFKSK